MNYNIDDDTTDYVKMCMGLAILPIQTIRNDAIPQLSGELLQKAPPSCQELLAYMESTWFSRIPDWSVYGWTTRTNNSVEGMNLNFFLPH